MSQCVPNWYFDEESIMTEINKLLADSTLLDTPQEAAPSLQECLTELTWKRGSIAMHGLDERLLYKPISPWDDTPRGDGTLESVVNQATCRHSSVDDINKIVLWFDHEITDMVDPGATTVPFDPLVPCHDNMLMHDYNQEPYTHVQGTGISSAVGCPIQLVSLGAAAYPASLGINSNTVEREILGDMELTLLANTISGQNHTKTSVDHYDSISHSRSQRKEADEGKTKIGKGRSSIAEKKKRAAAIHNEAERKRRERINQKMKALQSIVPNSSKTDKASLLHTVTEYVKQLQEQVQMLCRMYVPLLMQHQKLQMPITKLKKGDMDTDNINHAAALPPAVTPPPFMPALLDNSGNCLPMPPTTVEAMSAPPVILQDNSGNSLSTPPMDSVMLDPFATLLPSQPQPMTMDAYNRLATMSQQMQHPPRSKN